MKKRLFISLLGMLVSMVTMAITQPEDGKYYRIVNQNPDKSVNTEGVRHGYVITENTTSHLLRAEEPGSETKYNQIWKYTNKKFQNAHSEYYIASQGSTSNQFYTTKTGNTVTINDKGSYFILVSGMQIHADGSNNIVGWNDEGNTSNHWDFEEVTVDEAALAIVHEQYQKEQAEKAALEAIAAKSDTYAKIVAGYFTDAACTELNAACAAKSDEQMKDMMTADGLPEQLQTIVLRIKNKWSDELNPTMSERFRVANYKCYTQQSIKHQVGSTQLGDQNNPTGIWTNTLELMYVFVGDDIPEGTSLRIVGGSGAEVDRQYWNGGTALKKGLNIIYCGNENSYQWIMYSAPGDLTKNIDRFPALKIHIEGGDVLGYADIAGMGEDEANALYEATLKHANAMMKAKGVSTTKMNFAVKGERGLFLWPVDAYNQIWSDRAWNGKVYGYKIWKSMKFYDNVLMWEWSAMGWQDRVESGDATSEKTRENLAPGAGNAYYPSKINNLAATMMYYAGKNPYSSDNYTCMPSVGAIESSYNAERADFDTWCVGHESGHNNQGTINLPSSMESSNNYFSNIITYLNGYRMSRGMTFMENMDYVKDDVIFPHRSISMTLRMYFNLYLYYHRAQRNMTFTQSLHKLLRNDGMWFGGNGWYEGPNGGANRGSAVNSWLKFYEKACDAAKEDLTEYFRMWGFFIPVTDAYCGDYSSYYITCTQKDIDAAIKRVKAKGYPENKQIMFIEDRLVPQQRFDAWATPGAIKPTNDGNLNFDEAKLKEWYGDLGYVDDYLEGSTNKAVENGYTYSVAGTSVVMKGKGGVGIIVYNEDGTIGWMSNRLTFSMPAKVASGNFTIKVINGDGSEVNALNAVDSNDPAILKEALEAAIAASKDYTKMVDDKTVGFYTSESMATLNALVAKGQAALTNGSESDYKELAKAIGEEIINVSLNAEKNKLEPTAIYTVKNYSRGRYLSTGSSTVTDASAKTSQWVFVPTGDEGWYYMQNVSTKQLINDYYTVDATTLASAKKVLVKAAYEGSWFLEMTNSKGELKCMNNTPSYEQMISWSEDGGSAWYLSKVGEINGIDESMLAELISDTKMLLDQAGSISVAVEKLPLQSTDANAPYYIKTNREDSAYPIANLIDNSKATTFYTKSGGTALHNFTVDLGEGNEANYLRLTCMTNKEMDGRSPKTIIAMPSTGMTSGFVTSQKTEFTDLPAGTAKQESYYRDTKEASQAYRYWRFQVSEVNTSTTETRPYFALAYIQIRALVASVKLNDAYSTLDTKLFKSTNEAYNSAQTKFSALNTLLSNKDTYNTLKTAYDKLLAAMEAITPTAIGSMEAEAQQDAIIYNLNGQRVNKAQKGLYIINGKKVLVK